VNEILVIIPKCWSFI